MTFYEQRAVCTCGYVCLCALTFICERLHGFCDLVGSVEGVGGLGEIPQTFNGHFIKHRAERRDDNKGYNNIIITTENG